MLFFGTVRILLGANFLFRLKAVRVVCNKLVLEVAVSSFRGASVMAQVKSLLGVRKSGAAFVASI